MSAFKVKMHQIRSPDPARGAYSAPPDHLHVAVFKGPTSKGMEGKRGGEWKRRGRKREGRGGEWRGGLPPGLPPPPQLGSLDPPV